MRREYIRTTIGVLLPLRRQEIATGDRKKREAMRPELLTS
jgi:hypothetical protein